MTTGTPPPNGQRMLAAIVFTDVVGFSTLAGMDEARALRILARDTDLIREIAKQHGALVAKSTGDGLLMCFASAVEAVQSSIEIQKAVQDQNRTLPAGETLKHRIGIHLGDVVLMPDDVVGDGVNIAARIQNEAKPGGISMSASVYDLVRGKFPLRAVNLGPRNLKGIVDVVNVWQIPPPDEPISQPRPIPAEAQAAAFELDVNRGSGPPSPQRLVMMLLAAIVCLGGLGFLVAMMVRPTTRPAPMKPTKPVLTQPYSEDMPLTGGPSESPTRPEPKTPEPPKPETEVAPPSADGTAGAGNDPLLTAYEFDTAADTIERTGSTDPKVQSQIALLREAGNFVAMMRNMIVNTPASRPLTLTVADAGGGDAYSVWGEAGQIFVKNAEGEKSANMSDFVPKELLRIAAVWMRSSSSNPQDRPRMSRGAKAFAELLKISPLPPGL